LWVEPVWLFRRSGTDVALSVGFESRPQTLDLQRFSQLRIEHMPLCDDYLQDGASSPINFEFVLQDQTDYLRSEHDVDHCSSSSMTNGNESSVQREGYLRHVEL